MGLIFGKTMEAQFQKQQDFMIEMNRITLERQIQMQNQMRERMMAAQVARARELFVWLGSFYAISAVAMIAGFRRSRKPAAVAPLLPLTFIVGYQADLAYGSKLNRIKAEAENILWFEHDLIDMPAGLPTVASLDVGRMKQQEEAKFKGVSAPPEPSSP